MDAGSLWPFFFLICVLAALPTRVDAKKKAFNCTGGVIYFSAHPVDGLLFQNPDLLHDLYVLKCVTTVVFTSGDRGVGGTFSLSLERGLQESYAYMSGLPVFDPARKEHIILIGTHHVPSWSLRGMPNIQIIYLRLPDGLPSGYGHDMYEGQSLTKLYNKQIDSITSTDGLATYTLRDLKELIAFILQMKKPNDIKILNDKAVTLNGKKHAKHIDDHADHIASAKLVQAIASGESIQATVHAYAGSNVRKLWANINSTQHDFARKASAFFKYAAYDEHMCQSLEECSSCHHDGDTGVSNNDDDDVRYTARYLEREYHVI